MFFFLSIGGSINCIRSNVLIEQKRKSVDCFTSVNHFVIDGIGLVVAVECRVTFPDRCGCWRLDSRSSSSPSTAIASSFSGRSEQNVEAKWTSGISHVCHLPRSGSLVTGIQDRAFGGSCPSTDRASGLQLAVDEVRVHSADGSAGTTALRHWIPVPFVLVQVGNVAWAWTLDGMKRATLAALLLYTCRGLMGFSTQLPVPQEFLGSGVL